MQRITEWDKCQGNERTEKEEWEEGKKLKLASNMAEFGKVDMRVIKIMGQSWR